MFTRRWGSDLKGAWETVRAIWLTEFGAPSALVPGEGQVLVDVEAASVLFAETPARAGRSMAPFPLPAAAGDATQLPARRRGRRPRRHGGQGDHR
jgi:hypothetical protein